MYEEQALIAAGMPFSEAYPMCRDIKKEIAAGRFEPISPIAKEHQSCKCGGQGNCQDCPNRNK